MTNTTLIETIKANTASSEVELELVDRLESAIDEINVLMRENAELTTVHDGTNT